MPQDFVSEASSILDGFWSEICELGEKGQLDDWISDEDLIESIRSAINSTSKTYRYVLPTQIIAKLADSTLDSQCLQSQRGGPGAFDARTIAHNVIVPFDQANENVLGGSVEPYVSNPLRVPEISEKHRNSQRNKKDWDHLCFVLSIIEERNDHSLTESVFKQVLTEIYRRFSEVRVVYPIPKRIRLEKCMKLIESFIGEHSGGDRLLALTSALFIVIGKKFKLYSKVNRAKITASDISTGMLADLECVSKEGEIIFVVEVKDRELTISQIKGKIPAIREKKITEIFFIAQRGVSSSDEQEIASLVDHEFTSGHNIYITDLITLGRVISALLGEQGRREFLEEVGRQLDQYNSDIKHRKAWAELLASV